MTADTAGNHGGKPGRGPGVLRRIGYLIIGTALILWATTRELTNMGPGDGRIVPAPQGGTPTRVQATEAVGPEAPSHGRTQTAVSSSKQQNSMLRTNW